MSKSSSAHVRPPHGHFMSSQVSPQLPPSYSICLAGPWIPNSLAFRCFLPLFIHVSWEDVPTWASYWPLFDFVSTGTCGMHRLDLAPWPIKFLP